MHLPRPSRLLSGGRTKVRRLLSLLLVLLAPAAASSAAQSAAAPRFAPGELERRLQRISQRFESERVDSHIPGLALGVVVDDQVVLLQGFGVADVESGRAVTPQTLFAIGSSTKAFTATLCAMLVDEGRLQWDDPITKYVPEFLLHPEPGPGAPWGKEPEVSVRDVLSHRTGFSRNDVLWAGNTVPRETILRTASGAEPWAPYRSEFLYNNVQVMAAGVAAGRIEGTDWDTLLARRLLQPLHMNATNSSVTACADDPQLSLGYVWDAGKQSFRHLPMRNLDAIAPAGSINSNVTDMAQWLRLMLGGGAIDGQRLVSLAALEETWSPQILTGGTDSYGLCWFLSEWQGRRVVEHGGNIDGFGAEVALLPDDGIGFVLLTNVSATPLQQTSRGIVFEGLLGAEPAAAVAASAGGTRGNGASAPGDLSAGAPGAGALDEYVGAYTCNSPGYRDEDFHVVVRGDGLAIDVPRQTVYALRAPNAEGRWVFELTDTIEIDFQRNADGAVAALTMYQSGLALEMPKVGVEQHADEPLEPLARLLGEYVGDGQHLTVVIHNQRLSIDSPGQMIYELRPADEHGLRAFRAVDGFTAEFEERDGVVIALTTHQPNGSFRFERTRPAGDSPAGGASAGGEDSLPDLSALMALRGASAEAANWEALGGWRLTGGMRFANAGLSGALTSSFRGQTHFHEETDFGPYGFARQASDGTTAWTESVFSPWRELDGNELRQSLQTPANLLGDWRVRFADIRVLRRDEVSGRPAIVVALQDGELPPVTVWVSSENGDILRVDSAELLPGGQQLPQTITFSDWRDVGRGDEGGSVGGAGGGEGTPSVRVPFHSVTKSEATGRIEVQYELAETGLAFPDTLFRLEPPAAPADAAAPAPATEPATAPAPRR